MGKYLKLFQNHNGYTAYTADTENFLLPNVSYCIEQDEVHFNPYNEPSQGLVFIATYNQDQSMEPVFLYAYYAEEGDEEWWIRGIDMFSKIEIDGVEVSIEAIDSDEGYYTFTSQGEHTVRYTLKEGVTNVKDWAFADCVSLTSMIIPNGVTSIGNGLFNFCTSLASITIPNSVTSIEEEVFHYCYSLVSITIPSGVTRIEEYTFNMCSGLSSISVDANNQVYDSRNNCNAIIETNTNTLVLGSNNTIIPNNVTIIGNGAFDGLSMNSITIPNSVTSIGDYAFADCTSLSRVTCLPTTPPTLGVRTFLNNATGRKIYVPSGSVNAYKTASGWSAYASDIESIGGVPLN
ncbi:MAG: leucine-rich repeat protein [Bacteroidaceae bacterium]|nr:leucine-rich repeat protein [Bacteroidaceae bacterium]